jgi:hypothetical protein
MVRSCSVLFGQELTGVLTHTLTLGFRTSSPLPIAGHHSHDLLKIIADNQRSICVKNVYVELYSICGECVYPPDWRVYLKIARSQIQSSIIMNHHVLHWTLRGVWIYTKYRSVQSIHNIIISLSSTLYRCFSPISPRHRDNVWRGTTCDSADDIQTSS